MGDLVAAEWLKLRTTRLLLGMGPVVVAVSLAAVAGSVLAADRSDVVLASTEGLQRVLPVMGTGAVLVLLVGIIVSAGEYRHGTAAETFLSTPRRGRVVVAKLAVAGGLGACAGVAMSVASIALAAVLYRLKGAALPLGDVELWSTLGGVVAYTTVFAVLGAGLGALIRNQVLAVAVVLGWIAFVEHILFNLVPAVGRWLPAAVGQAVVRAPLEDVLAPATGLLVLVLYALVAAVAATWVVRVRDV